MCYLDDRILIFYWRLNRRGKRRNVIKVLSECDLAIFNTTRILNKISWTRNEDFLSPLASSIRCAVLDYGLFLLLFTVWNPIKDFKNLLGSLDTKFYSYSMNPYSALKKSQMSVINYPFAKENRNDTWKNMRNAALNNSFGFWSHSIWLASTYWWTIARVNDPVFQQTQRNAGKYQWKQKCLTLTSIIANIKRIWN